MAGKPRAQDKKRGGFKVGPKLGKGVYQGHAKKIKETLIHKAKVKRSYHKALAAEGYATGANGGGLGVRRAEVVSGGQGESGEEEDDGDEEMEMEGALGEEEKEEQRQRMRRQLAVSAEDEEDEQEAADSDSEEEGGRGGGRVRPQQSSTTSAAVPSAPPARQPLPSTPYPGPTPKTSSRRPSAPTPAPVAPTPAPSKPLKKPKLTEAEIAAIRERKAAERRDWGKRGAKGQPKLGGRVEQLLGRIQRSMA